MNKSPLESKNEGLTHNDQITNNNLKTMINQE